MSRLHVRRFARAETGVAALEFALVLPLLVLLFMGSIEIARFYLISKRVSNVAASISQMLSTSPKTQSVLSLNYLANSIYTVPTLEPDTMAKGGRIWGAHNVSIASIEFVPVNPSCQTSTCDFDARVKYTYSIDPEKIRKCGKATKVADGVALNHTTLPASLYGPGSVIAVDISYSYTPLFGTRFFGDLTLFRSAFMAPRYLSVLAFGPAKAPNLIIC
jgi:Flp pilus assembly pilin Flp